MELTPAYDLAQNRQWRIWMIVLALALLLHLLFFLVKIEWLAVPAPPPVEVQPFDPSRLDSLREQWKKKNEPQQFLLNKDKSKPPATEEAEPAPDNARYFSDRNRTVEKEQRARDTAILPKTPSGPRSNTRPKTAPRRLAPPQAQARPRSEVPSVSDLGIPLNLRRMAVPPAQQQASVPEDARARGDAGGGDQWVDDQELPLGSENLLNTQQSVYYSFYARLYEAIGPLWQSRLNSVYDSRRLRPGDYTTVAEVVMDAQGNVEAVHIVRSSGVEAFDAAVVDSWRKIERFPNPPQGLLEEDGKVHTGWNFRVQVGNGVGLHFLPPKRAY